CGLFGLAQGQAGWREKQNVTHQGAQERTSNVVLFLPLAEVATTVMTGAIRREDANGTDLGGYPSPTGNDPNPGDVGRGTVAQGAAGIAAVQPPGVAVAAGGAVAVAGQARACCARCGRAGASMRDQSLSRHVSRFRKRALLAGIRPPPPYAPSGSDRRKG